ncbi:MAG: hypothetical protein WC847_03340 [Candidatus Paceibacterota bacterium]|jgi:hypothetical protein
MFGGNKNLKDSVNDLGLTIKDSTLVISYSKTNGLITALYMVTDIIDKDEPLRNKLRTLGAEIISDINSIPTNASSKIREVMSFLDIAFAINIISEMNCSILRKEFLELHQSIQSAHENKEAAKSIKRQINLSEFFIESDSAGTEFSPKGQVQNRNNFQSMSVSKTPIGHATPTRIGVQKGSTLMQALSDKNLANIGGQKFGRGASVGAHHVSTESSDLLKKQRREDIINILKTVGGNATIKDIKDRAMTTQSKTGSLVSCSEKTLQRELVSMVNSGVLKKAGEKRWSRYFIK